MKKILFILIVVTFISQKINAQYSINAGAVISNITCGGNDSLWVKLSDWTNLNSGTPNNLYSVYFTDSITGYAVGDTGIIIQTTNGGNTWDTLNSGTPNNLYSVYFTDSNTGYAVGNAGTIIKTTDRGNTWTNNAGYAYPFWSVYFPDADTGYAVGYGGIVIQTTDGGNTWNTIRGYVGWYLYSVYFPNANTGYAVGGNGTIIKTTDGGNTWKTLNSSSSTSVYFTDANTGYDVGENGIIIKTTDGGNTWNTVNSGTNNNLNSVYFPNANTGYAVGGGGTIIQTTDAGNTWNTLNSGTTRLLYSVCFPNANTGYAVGGGGVILKYQQPLELTYKWSPATGLNATDIANPIANPTITTTYKVTVTTNYPSLNPPIDSVIITVNPLTANAGTNQNIICGGTAQLDNVTSNYTGTGTLAYNWAPATGLNYDIISNPIATVIGNTTYFVTVTTPNGCTAVSDVTVNVSPLTADAGTDKTIICGVSAQLDSVTSNYTGTGNLTYNWAPTTGLNYDTISNPIATVIGNTTYFVTVTTPNGCTAVSDVTVNVSPLTADAGTDKTIICGGSAQLDNVTSNYTGTGVLTYNWSPATGLNNDSILNPTAAVIGNTTYFVTVTTPNGCTAVSDVTVNVNPLTINVSNTSTTCGTADTLSTTNNYTGSGTLTYNWQPITGLSAANVSNPAASPVTETIYTVTVTTPNGCVATNQARVTLNPLPAEQICYVEFDTITSKNSINWSTNLSAKIDSVHIYNEVSTTVWNRIGSVTARKSNFIDMGSNPFNQSYSYKISVKDTCGYETDSSTFHTTITLLAAYNSGTNTYGFTWSAYQGLTIENYFLFGIKSNRTDSLIISVPGNHYFYNYTNPYPGFVNYFVGFNTSTCSEKSNHLVRSNVVQSTITGINQLTNFNEQLTIYPNPANDIVTIDFQGYIGRDKTMIGLYSITGELIKMLPIQSALTQVNISDLAEGVYIIKVTNDNGVAVKRVVKE